MTVQLAAQLKLEQNAKAAQDKLAKAKLTQNKQVEKVTQPAILRMAKLVGVISLNGTRKAVIEYKDKSGKVSLLTLQTDEKFAEGRVIQVGMDFVVVDVQGTITQLPLFKNKKMTFSGEKNKGK